MRKYVWYCAEVNELFTVNFKPKKLKEQYVVFFHILDQKVYMSKTAFYIGEL